MNREGIAARIQATELELLILSERVATLRNHDSMQEWLQAALASEPALARRLRLPTQAGTKAAVRTILRSQSPLTSPLISLLSKRIRAFVATVGEVHTHPWRGAILDPLMVNFAHLFALLKDYSDAHEHKKTVQGVYEALLDHRLHIYSSQPGEPNLRIVLRAFYKDPHCDTSAALLGLLDFVLSQLKIECQRTGHIGQPRHAWWALYTLISRSPDDWLSKNKRLLSKAVLHLLRSVEYSPRVDRNSTSFVPELDSTFNEMAWVAINALRILRSNGSTHLSAHALDGLEQLIHARVDGLAGDDGEASLKDIQTRLILLYEASAFLARAETISLASTRTLDIRSHSIGTHFYEEGVLATYKPARDTVLKFIREPGRWQKATLTSLLISGHPGQGKSSLAADIAQDVVGMANDNNARSEIRTYTFGTDIKSRTELGECLKQLKTGKESADVRVVIFDEFDKVPFDVYTPFLPFLENTVNGCPITVYLFAQSCAPTRDLFRTKAKQLSNAARDFLTRLQLGGVDLPDLKVSPQQRLMSLIGISDNGKNPVRRISSDAVVWFGFAENILNNRDLMREASQRTVTEPDGSLVLAPTEKLRLAGRESSRYRRQRWISLQR